MNLNRPSVMVDTSFLGNLMDSEAIFNRNALLYFLQLQQHKAKFYIPSLVVAEYSLKGDIENVIDALSARVVSFDTPEALAYAKHVKEFNWFPAKMPRTQRRDAVIDLMLISQALIGEMDAFITADKGLCNRVPSGVSLTLLDVSEPIENTSELWRQANGLN